MSATVGFPVTVGGQIAIPKGTKAEGTITTFKSSYESTHQPEVAIQFTRLLYPDGYTVMLDTPATAKLIPPTVTFSLADVTLFDTGWQFQMTTQSAFTVDAAKVTATAAPVAR